MIGGSFLERLMRATVVVSLGTFAIKAGLLVFNAVLANATDKVAAGELIRVSSFLLAYATVVHFATAKYVAREITRKSEEAKGALALSLALSLAGAAIVGAIALQSAPQAVAVFFGGSTLLAYGYLTLAALAYGMADLLTQIAAGTGHYRSAMTAQMLSSLGYGFSSLALFLDLPGAFYLGLALPVAAAAANVAVLLRTLWRRDFALIRPRLSTWFHFSFPSFVSGLTINPLVMWAVNNVAKLDNHAILAFVAAQNLFGLTVLLAGQVNSASFFLLAREQGSRRMAWLAAGFAASTALAVGLVLFLLRNQLDLVYGSIGTALVPVVPWIVAAAVAFALTQVVLVRLFLMGFPWLEALSGVVFAIVMLAVSAVANGRDDAVLILMIGLAAGYTARLLSGLGFYRIMGARKEAG